MALDYGLLGGNQPAASDVINRGFAFGQQQQMQQQQLQQQQMMQQQEQELMQRALSGDVPSQVQIVLSKAKSGTEAQAGLSMLDAPRRQEDKNLAYSWDSMARTNPTALREQIASRIEALNNSEPTQGNQQQLAVLKAMQLSPDSSLPMNTLAMIRLADGEGFEKYAKAISEAQAAPLEREKLQADINKTKEETATVAPKAKAELDNIKSQILERSKRLTLDADRLNFDMDKAVQDLELRRAEAEQKGKKISPEASKLINEATLQAASAKSDADSITSLADKIELNAKDMKAGVFAKSGEWLARQSGQEDYISNLRKEYNRIMTQGVMKSLPPGAASDKDIELARSGFLSETANPQQIASFLRGMAKVRTFEASRNQLQADWAQENGGLGRANSDIVINGRTYPKGMTLQDAYRYAGKDSGKSSNTLSDLTSKYGG